VSQTNIVSGFLVKTTKELIFGLSQVENGSVFCLSKFIGALESGGLQSGKNGMAVLIEWFETDKNCVLQIDKFVDFQDKVIDNGEYLIGSEIFFDDRAVGRIKVVFAKGEKLFDKQHRGGDILLLGSIDDK